MSKMKTSGNNKISKLKALWNNSSLMKKIIAFGSAIIMVVSSGAAAKMISDSKPATQTSLSDTNNINNGNDEEKDETFNPENILYKPYSIKSNEELNAILNDVKELTKITIDSRFIKCLHYDLLDENTVITKEAFKDMNADEFSNWFYENELNYYKTLHYGIAPYVQLKNAILDGESEDVIEKYKDALPSKVTTAYTTIPTEAKGYKTYQLKLDKLLEKELNDIKTGNTSEFENNAKEFLTIVQDVRKDNTLLEGERFAILEQAKANHALFSAILDKIYPEENKELKDNFQSNMITTVYSSSLTLFGYSLDPKNGVPCTAAKEYEKYVAEDAKKANSYKPDVKESTKNVTSSSKSSGKKSTTKERIETATTSVSESTSIVKVPEEESKKAETTTKKPGGNPVGTTSVVTETTTLIYEYDVQPGSEVYYSDSDLSASNDMTR